MPNQTYGEHIPFVCNRSSDCINCFLHLFVRCSHPIRIALAIFPTVFQMCPAKASARPEIYEHDGMAVYG